MPESAYRKCEGNVHVLEMSCVLATGNVPEISCVLVQEMCLKFCPILHQVSFHVDINSQQILRKGKQKINMQPVNSLQSYIFTYSAIFQRPGKLNQLTQPSSLNIVTTVRSHI